VVDGVTFGMIEDDLASAERDAERLRGDALVERARIIAEALREGERLAEGVRAEAGARLDDAERTADEWLAEADAEKERVLSEARALAADLLAEVEEEAEDWLAEVELEKARLLAEAGELEARSRTQAAAAVAAASAVTAVRLDDAGARAQALLRAAEAERDGLLAGARTEAVRIVAVALERRVAIEEELDRLRAQVAEASSAVAPTPSTALVPVARPEPEVARHRWSGRVVGVAAAAATALVVTAGAVGLVLRGDGGPDEASAAAPGDPLAEAWTTAAGTSGSDELTLTSGDDLSTDVVVTANADGYVDADPLPALDSERTYQLWGRTGDGDEVVPLGRLGPDPGIVRFTVPEGTETLEVTAEDDPGATAPTDDPVVAGDLTGS
jgi:cell division septum initiation protein DivIVA